MDKEDVNDEELGIQEEDTFVSSGRGAWDMDGIKALVQKYTEKFDVFSVKTDAFISRFHPAGMPKYKGYSVKKKIQDAGTELGINLAASQRDKLGKVFVKKI